VGIGEFQATLPQLVMGAPENGTGERTGGYTSQNGMILAA